MKNKQALLSLTLLLSSSAIYADGPADQVSSLQVPKWLTSHQVSTSRGKLESLLRQDGGSTALHELWKKQRYQGRDADVTLTSKLDTDKSSYCAFTVGVRKLLKSNGVLPQAGISAEMLWTLCNTCHVSEKVGDYSFVYKRANGVEVVTQLVDLKQQWPNRNTLLGVKYCWDTAGHRDQLVTIDWAKKYLIRLEKLGRLSTILKKCLQDEVDASMFKRVEDKSTKYCKQPHSGVEGLKNAGLMCADGTMHDSVVILANLKLNHPALIDSMQPPIK